MKLSPPENLDFTKPAEWPQWKAHFESYRIASKLNIEEFTRMESGALYK